MEEEYIQDDVETNIDNNETDLGNNKYWFALWITFCIFFSLWFLKKVMRGRQQLRCNFDAIEKELKRIQTIVDNKEKNDNSTEDISSETKEELMESDKDK